MKIVLLSWATASVSNGNLSAFYVTSSKAREIVRDATDDARLSILLPMDTRSVVSDNTIKAKLPSCLILISRSAKTAAKLPLSHLFLMTSLCESNLTDSFRNIYFFEPQFTKHKIVRKYLNLYLNPHEPIKSGRRRLCTVNRKSALGFLELR